VKLKRASPQFSLPLNPFLSPEDFQGIYLPFVKKYQHLIGDIYFTCRIPPFDQDAMGAMVAEQDREKLIKQALYLQQETGIPVLPVFNHPSISPATENLQLFIKNFKPLYKQGIRCMTMVQAHWVGTLKQHFPECKIKSSLMRPVSNAQNLVDFALLGFDVIQVDRNLMRNQIELKSMAKARQYLKEKRGIEVDLCLLANEQCRGLCPVQHEHYLYNVQRKGENSLPYMFSSLCKEVSCNAWKDRDAAYRLKTCNLPPWKENWDDILQYVQSFKLHGRDDINTLMNSMRIIKNYHQGLATLDEEKDDFFASYQISERKKEQWLKTIANCRTQCWQCNLCDTLVS